MKNILLVILVSLNVLVALGQSKTTYKDEYGRVIGYSESTPIRTDNYVSQFVPMDLSAMQNALERRQAEYDQNKKYLYSLKQWIYELLTKTNEEKFASEMTAILRKVSSIEDEDLSLYSSYLSKIDDNIKEAIMFYNKRISAKNDEIKERPKKLWESGNKNLEDENYSQAIKDYTNLIQLNPDFPGAYRNRGYAYFAQEKYSLALSDLNKSIEFKNDDAFAFSKRGWSKYYLDDLMGAMSDFNKEIELEPGSATAYYNRGSVKSQLNDQNGAISDYTKSIELQPNFSMAYNNRGWSKYQLKKYTEALLDLNKAIELDLDNWVAYDSRQQTKFALNDFKGCIVDCNIALNLNAKCANSRLYRGRCYFKQGLKVEACQDWSKAGELGEKEAYDFISKYCH